MYVCAVLNVDTTCIYGAIKPKRSFARKIHTLAEHTPDTCWVDAGGVGGEEAGEDGKRVYGTHIIFQPYIHAYTTIYTQDVVRAKMQVQYDASA